VAARRIIGYVPITGQDGPVRERTLHLRQQVADFFRFSRAAKLLRHAVVADKRARAACQFHDRSVWKWRKQSKKRSCAKAILDRFAGEPPSCADGHGKALL